MSGDALWYKDATIYELRVRAFYDSNGDGIGDFPGLTQKLDYLQDLGIDTLWLLPFYPSPLRDDGYDISHYTEIHPDLGTLQDFKTFVREAHKRGLRVVTELVLNHVSDQHGWFQRARQDPKGKYRDYFVWSDSTEKYHDARIIFKDFESSNWAWDPGLRSYYWHRFYRHQPDLNFDNPAVRKEVLAVVDYWLGLGVDGLRLDAVPYLFEREGTNCENLPETHAFLKTLRRHVDQKFKHRMLLAEANQWPEDAVTYFGDGDECHMAFHFPIMPRLFMALHMEDRFPIVDILDQTPAIPDSAQWALFLRNHDELTLEMVTDEERDYMYRVYAHDPQARINLGIRRRLAPLLSNNRRRIELMNALLFSLPGTPVLYYGDEIGMGDNFYLGDRHGVRTPMQWSGDRNAGFSRANPQRLYLPVVVDPEYHYEAINVETQLANPHSLLWWTRRLLGFRKRYKAFGRGSIEFLQPRNPKILAFLRRYGEEQVLVVANLSRFAQYAELDLSAFRGLAATELFGGTEFPPIGDLPYLLTLGPHSFYWFLLAAPRGASPLATSPVAQLPVLTVSGSWNAVVRGDDAEALAGVLPRFLQGQRWFAGKARRIESIRLRDVGRVPVSDGDRHLLLAAVAFGDGSAETYVLPVGFATGDRAAELERYSPDRLIARLTVRGGRAAGSGVLFDAGTDRALAATWLDAIRRRRRFRGADGTLTAGRTRALAALLAAVPPGESLEPEGFRAEQSNSSVTYGHRLILKLLRRVEDGINPELEVGRFLSERTAFPNAAPLGGFLEYKGVGRGGSGGTLAVLHGYVANEGDAWTLSLDEVERYFERIAVRPAEPGALPLADRGVLELTTQDPPPPLVAELVGNYLDRAGLLGRRTAEMHLALASTGDDPAFSAERFSSLYQRSLYQSMRTLTRRVFRLLAENVRRLPKAVAAEAEQVLPLEARVLQGLRALTTRKLTAMRIRVHGDYHLGQVLFTGKDFVIIDFEGEPLRPVTERRIKRSPLRDVAGMLRSFHYAAASVAATRVVEADRPDARAALAPWGDFWYRWVSSAFLRAYLAAAEKAPFLPRTREELAVMLQAYVLEKAVYEVGYELNNRPDWAWIPLQGIRELLEHPFRA